MFFFLNSPTTLCSCYLSDSIFIWRLFRIGLCSTCTIKTLIIVLFKGKICTGARPWTLEFRYWRIYCVNSSVCRKSKSEMPDVKTIRLPFLMETFGALLIASVALRCSLTISFELTNSAFLIYKLNCDFWKFRNDLNNTENFSSRPLNHVSRNWQLQIQTQGRPESKIQTLMAALKNSDVDNFFRHRNVAWPPF